MNIRLRLKSIPFCAFYGGNCEMMFGTNSKLLKTLLLIVCHCVVGFGSITYVITSVYSFRMEILRRCFILLSG